MKRSYFCVGLIVWFASLVIAFSYGRSKMSSTTSVYDTARPKHAKALDHLNDLNDPETALEGDSAAMTEAVETLSAFFEGAEMTLSEAINQVDRLSADEARNFLVEAFALPSADPRRSRLINNLLEQLAKSHPQEAYDLTRSIGSLRDAERAKVAILEVWANRDPVAALAWSKTALADEPRHLYSSQMRALFRGYAEMNPQAALTAAQALPVGSKEEIRMRTQLMGEVIETQVREGQIQQATLAIEWIDDPDVRQSMNLELVDEWARFDPTGAATYVESLSEEATTRIKISLVDEWAESDPAAAAAWLSGLDAEDPAVARAASDLIREWTRYDLTASAEWLNSLPASPELDRAVANYTFRAAQEDPANAMSWAESVSNDRMRNRLMESVAGSWKSEDPAAFEQYLESAELTAEQKEQLLNAENRGYGGGRSPFGRR